MIFETHVHLNDPEYENYHELVEEALKNGVSKMVVVGYDLKSSIEAIKIANEYPFIYAAIGIHPSESNKDYAADLVELEKYINSKVVAIGEIGLDYHYGDINKDKQKDLFVKQIKIANKYDLPIIIHSRDAASDTLNILKENKTLYSKGIMHCYSYSLEMSKEFIRLGFLLGIGGVVTFKNAKEIKRVVENTDLKHLVLETDSPYLAPAPYRGSVNKPAYIKYVAMEVCAIKKEALDVVETATFNNAAKLFGVSHEN